MIQNCNSMNHDSVSKSQFNCNPTNLYEIQFLIQNHDSPKKCNNALNLEWLLLVHLSFLAKVILKSFDVWTMFYLLDLKPS